MTSPWNTLMLSASYTMLSKITWCPHLFDDGPSLFWKQMNGIPVDCRVVMIQSRNKKYPPGLSPNTKANPSLHTTVQGESAAASSHSIVPPKQPYTRTATTSTLALYLPYALFDALLAFCAKCENRHGISQSEPTNHKCHAPCPFCGSS